MRAFLFGGGEVVRDVSESDSGVRVEVEGRFFCFVLIFVKAGGFAESGGCDFLVVEEEEDDAGFLTLGPREEATSGEGGELLMCLVVLTTGLMDEERGCAWD